MRQFILRIISSRFEPKVGARRAATLSAMPIGAGARKPPPLAAPLLFVGAAVIVLVVHLATNGTLGFHTDEFYYIDSGRHPAVGYVDFPPIVPLLARLETDLLGATPWNRRLLPTLLGAFMVALSGAYVARPIEEGIGHDHPRLGRRPPQAGDPAPRARDHAGREEQHRPPEPDRGEDGEEPELVEDVGPAPVPRAHGGEPFGVGLVVALDGGGDLDEQRARQGQQAEQEQQRQRRPHRGQPVEDPDVRRRGRAAKGGGRAGGNCGPGGCGGGLAHVLSSDSDRKSTRL